ncbi:hypothetical protein D791_02327 [Nitrincola nitratireducens]|uniref:Uncharacterized protein n=1 Tax=Nitrincola nitratireducens TaxID=1229521 RepID=W9V3K2_9GAMM|nr:hypothetical protein D791_02327 [Nitrincola nitratireducens]
MYPVTNSIGHFGVYPSSIERGFAQPVLNRFDRPQQVDLFIHYPQTDGLPLLKIR